MDASELIQSAKRRKLDHATKVLARPFTTPFKQKRSTGEENGPTLAPEAKIKRTSEVLEEAPNDTAVNIHADRLNKTISSTASPILNQPLFSQMRRLEQQIRAVRSDIDTLERAAAIQGSENDARLRQLIKKWRRAAQEAADELFPSVKDRVNAMGGVSAWRQSENNKLAYNTFQHVNPEQRHDSFYDGTEHKKASTGSPVNTEHNTQDVLSSEATIDHEEDEKSYDMYMMLCSLNIDLAIIGYDMAAQSWTDDHEPE